MPALYPGGAERALINLLEKIDYSFYEVDLVLVLRKGILLNQVPPKVRMIWLFKNKFFVRILTFLQKKFDINFPFKIQINRKLFKKYDIAISYSDSNFTDLLFYYANINKRFAWVHASYRHNSSYFKYFRKKHYRVKVVNRRYNALDGIYFVSNDSLKSFIEIFGKFPKMDVIYNIIGVDTIKKKALENVTFQKSSFTFIAIGSLLPVKGFDRLIRSAKIIKDNGFKFKLLICGSGPEYKKLRNLIKKCGLVDYVELKGFVENPYPYLLHSDALVMSSLTEALPTVLCEAMVLGKPVIATNSTGCNELIVDGYYGLVAEQDDIDLANKMMMYLNDPNLLNLYASRALERAEIFNDNIILKKYYDIFDN